LLRIKEAPSTQAVVETDGNDRVVNGLGLVNHEGQVVAEVTAGALNIATTMNPYDNRKLFMMVP
jgi:hypothetical protein